LWNESITQKPVSTGFLLVSAILAAKRLPEIFTGIWACLPAFPRLRLIASPPISRIIFVTSCFFLLCIDAKPVILTIHTEWLIFMFKRLFPAPCLCLLTAPTWSQTDAGSAGADHQQAAPAEVEASDIAAEKILVVGQRARAYGKFPRMIMCYGCSAHTRRYPRT
jgi:hypothetical protein